MKKIFLVILTFFLGNIIVSAECNDQQISELKEKAKNIEAKYVYDPNAYFEEDGNTFPMEGGFDTNIYGMFDGVYLYDEEYDLSYYFSDTEEGVLKFGYLGGGNYSYKIISTECNTSVGTLKFSIPRYNVFANDSLCEGISGDELDVCSEWYPNQISYENFVKRVNEYKNQKLQNNDGEVGKDNILTVIKEFIESNYMYIVLSIVIFAFVAFLVVVKKKRSELK